MSDPCKLKPVRIDASDLPAGLVRPAIHSNRSLFLLRHSCQPLATLVADKLHLGVRGVCNFLSPPQTTGSEPVEDSTAVESGRLLAK